MNSKYIILDRDGVINIDSPDYIKTPEEWLPIPNSVKAITQLTQLNYQIIVVTNQSGLARHYYSVDMLNLIHQKMLHEVQKAGGNIIDIFFCPHGPEDNCLCRKPKAGLYNLIQEKYSNINFNQTYSIGDSLRDLQAAKKSGCLPVLVRTGNGQKTIEKIQTDPILAHFKALPIFDNLWSVSQALLKNNDECLLSSPSPIHIYTFKA